MYLVFIDSQFFLNAFDTQCYFLFFGLISITFLKVNKQLSIGNFWAIINLKKILIDNLFCIISWV